MRKPVFVDHTGRRRRAAVMLGSGLGVFLVVGLILLLAGLRGEAVPLPGWPDNPAQGPAAVPTQPLGKTTSPRPSTVKPKPSPTQATVPAQPTPGGPPTSAGPGNGNGHGPPSRPPGKP